MKKFYSLLMACLAVLTVSFAANAQETVAETSTLKVVLEGKGSKVDFAFLSGRKVTLSQGEQNIAFDPAREKRVYIQALNCNDLYLVELDGVKVVGRTQSEEGGKEVMQYNLSIKDGQTLHIVTEYPDEKFPVTINVDGDPYDNFITELTINGEPVEASAFEAVQAGDKIRVVGDDYNYKVLKSMLNGADTKILTSSISQIVEGPVEINFEVEYVERPYDYVMYSDGGTSWQLIGATGFKFSPIEGYELRHFAEDENPFKIRTFGLNIDLGDKGQSFIYQNNLYMGACTEPQELVINQGDVIKLFTGTSVPPFYMVRYTLEGIDDIEVITDMIHPEVWSAGHSALKNTLVEVKPVAGSIASVTVNDEAVEPDEEGRYMFTVTKTSNVFVQGTASGIIAVEADDAVSYVYNLQGVRLNATGSTANLPAGLYIVRTAGKTTKMLVK